MQWIKLYGPEWPRRIDLREMLGNYTPTDQAPLQYHCSTLNDALDQYCQQFNIRLWPYDGSNPNIPFNEGEEAKYFFYQDSSGRVQLVDIHIMRNNETLCPKQYLAFKLKDGDVIDIGELIC